MSDSYALTLKEIAHRLHIGESTLNVWRNRYREWIPETLADDPGCYPEQVLDVFRLIARCTHAGFENDEIRKVLESMSGEKKEKKPDPRKSPEGGERDTDGLTDVLSSLKQLMTGMVTQQERIAEAQERRAAAQERMAYAMESRAENELIKTSVMRELVTAIQDLSVKGSVNSLIEHVKNMPGPSPAELEDFSQDPGFDMDDLEELSEIGEDREQDVIIPDFDETAGVSHDRSVDWAEAPRDVMEDDFPELPVEEEAMVEMDDLSLLLDPEDTVSMDDMDDLSALLDPEDRISEPEDMDDLSLLLEPSDTLSMDDMDDLSKLIDDELPLPEPVSAAAPPPVEKPKARAEAPAEEDYKSKILKRIIQMKQKEGLSVEETAQRLNDEGLKTLSGKDHWDVRTIQGIYKYIDSFS